MKTALITGITGQDGAYLAKYLLGLGYRIVGTCRRTASLNLWRINELGIINDKNLKIIEMDLTDPFNILGVISQTKPDEIYNLAAQSFVGVSFKEPFHTASVTGLGVLNLLEAIRIVDKNIKFYQASTSEMFGKVQAVPQNETTPFHPRSPYGVAKLYGHWMTVNYRESYGVFGSSGILFNHESPLRGLEFVTRKITNTAAKIALKKADKLVLGNLDAKRDWGYAYEYVQGMHKILQHDKPDTFVLATNKTTTVRDFVKLSFEALDIELKFEGCGENEIARDKNGNILVQVSSEFYRPAEVDLLIGDPLKANNELDWRSTTDVKALCEMMIKADLKKVEAGFEF
ncbi:MAG: GDP-mannose 4,6-dehydratase [Campylobacter gracilis]|uniref:GDP-mannose 4,6-dehydratase n=1 Tax=Campylobacter gracilis TaxID=824 RepID=UPI0026EF188E|nr:GDP-mannose 4,6-dehydratase [Campylobacter gracilis]MBS6152001.1 GDP-mannose 4,6-dehydratase [Campylobacter gracilis]